MAFFMTNNLFSNNQYGFIKGRSTVLQLLKIIDQWTTNLETCKQIDIVYTDFEKAFDKVPHKRLLQKLKWYGLNEKIVRWVEAFLCYRTQKVKVNNSISNANPVLSGIPQGSVLGPLLFIFINDLPVVWKNLCDTFFFADDGKLYECITNDNDHVSVEMSCQNVFDWTETWCMKLNVIKRKVLTIAKNSAIRSVYHYEFKNSNDCVKL